MPSKPSPAPEVQTPLTGLAFGESSRWHTDRPWFARRLTALDIAADGGLSNRRVRGDLGDGVPGGIFVDAEHAARYADVPNKRCVRVREGGEVLQTISLDRGCFACMLAGGERSTLFLALTECGGMERMTDRAQTGQILTHRAPARGAGWP